MLLAILGRMFLSRMPARRLQAAPCFPGCRQVHGAGSPPGKVPGWLGGVNPWLRNKNRSCGCRPIWDGDDTAAAFGIHCTGACPNPFPSSAGAQNDLSSPGCGRALVNSSVGRQESSGQFPCCRSALQPPIILYVPHVAPHSKPYLSQAWCQLH